MEGSWGYPALQGIFNFFTKIIILVLNSRGRPQIIIWWLVLENRKRNNIRKYLIAI